MSTKVKCKRVVRNQFIDDQAEVSARTGLACLDPSRAIQSQKDDADINVIVARFGVGATLPETLRLPEYGDYSEVTDYLSSLTALEAADAAFMELPARVREQFDNSPQAFLEACEDPSKKSLLQELGLLKPDPQANPAVVNATA